MVLQGVGWTVGKIASAELPENDITGSSPRSGSFMIHITLTKGIRFGVAELCRNTIGGFKGTYANAPYVLVSDPVSCIFPAKLCRDSTLF
jgi:hypothetical protein